MKLEEFVARGAAAQDAVDEVLAQVEVEQLKPGPHAFTPLPGIPQYCMRCPEPREHRVHQPAEGERP